MRMRFWEKKGGDEDGGDLRALIERVQEVVARAGDELDREGERVIAQLEDDLRELGTPDLQAAAEEDRRVREALERIESDGRAHIDWLRGVAEARRGGVEGSRVALTRLLETALRQQSQG